MEEPGRTARPWQGRIRVSLVLSLLAVGGCGPGEVGGTELVQGFERTAAAAAGDVPEAAPPGAQGLSFARDTSERVTGVRIHDEQHRAPNVVYAVRLRDLRGDEQLRLRGEVTLSRCNPKDIAGESGDAAWTPCAAPSMRAYPYTPRFSAAFMIGDSPRKADGRRVSRWYEMRCHHDRHHCSLTLPEEVLDAPPRAAQKYVTIVVAADALGENAHAGDVMEVEKGHGMLAVTRRLPPAGRIAQERSTRDLLIRRSIAFDRPAEDGDPTQKALILYRVRLDGLRGGEVLDADARLDVVLGDMIPESCAPLITGELIVVKDRDAPTQTSPHDKRLTVKNGANCRDFTNDGCKYLESGAVRLGRDVPSTMYVNYVVRGLKSCVQSGYRWHADPARGFLSVHARSE